MHHLPLRASSVATIRIHQPTSHLRAMHYVSTLNLTTLLLAQDLGWCTSLLQEVMYLLLRTAWIQNDVLENILFFPVIYFPQYLYNYDLIWGKL